MDLMPNRVGQGLRRSRKKKTEEESTVFPLALGDDNTYSDEDNNTVEAPEPSDTNDEQDLDMSTDTFQEYETDEYQGEQDAEGESGNDFGDVDYTSVIEELPEDFKPSRPSAGRKRIPTQFDDLVEQWSGKGYKSIAFRSDEEAEYISKMLRKATSYRELGMDLTVNKANGHVEFQIRPKQERRKNKGEAGGDGGNGEDAVNAGTVDTSDPDA